jgi:hypothetical protein
MSRKHSSCSLLGISEQFPWSDERKIKCQWVEMLMEGKEEDKI